MRLCELAKQEHLTHRDATNPTVRPESLGLSRRGRECSQVIPDHPPAAPFFEHLRLLKKRSASKANVDVARCSITLSGKGSRGRASRRDGFVRDLKMAKFPGATHDPSKACLADDN